MDKKEKQELSETDIRAKFVTPAIKNTFRNEGLVATVRELGPLTTSFPDIDDLNSALDEPVLANHSQLIRKE